MLPLLYESTQSIVAPDRMVYLGRLTKCEKCDVSEDFDNNYTLSATFAPTEELINEIQSQRFILAKPNPFDEPQFFEITDYDFDEIARLTLSARHIKHNAYNNAVLPTIADGAQSATPLIHWNNCCTRENLAFDNFFVFDSAINSAAKMEIGYTRADTLGLFIEEMARAFNAEFHYNNFNINLLASRGERKNYVLRWNKNIAAPKLSISGADIYSHVIAYGDFTAKYTKDGHNYEFPVQLCSNPVNLTTKRQRLVKMYMYNASNLFESTEINPLIGTGYSGIKTQLNSFAYNFAHSSASTAVKTAESVNLSVNWQPALEDMKEIGLGDTIDTELKGGRLVEARVTKTVFDSLSERWVSIELGHAKRKLADYIAKRR